MNVRVAIVSAVRLYGDGLAECLKTRGNISIVGNILQFSDIDTLSTQTGVDILLFDASVITTRDEVRQLISRFPETRVVAVALSETEQEVIAWAEAGVSAYVPRQATLNDLYGAIFSAMRGEQVCSPRIAGSLLRGLRRRPYEPFFASERLTCRESETLELMATGLSNKQIAEKLNISVSTVKNHVHTILEKLCVRTRAEAVAQMHRHRTRVLAS